MPGRLAVGSEVATPRRRAWCVRRQVAGTGKTAGRAEVASGMRAPDGTQAPGKDPPRRAIGPAAGADDSMTENEQTPVAGEAPAPPRSREALRQRCRGLGRATVEPAARRPFAARRRTPAAPPPRTPRAGWPAEPAGGPGQPAGSAPAAELQRGRDGSTLGPPRLSPSRRRPRTSRGFSSSRARASAGSATPSAATCRASTSRCLAGSWSACTSSLVCS